MQRTQLVLTMLSMVAIGVLLGWIANDRLGIRYAISATGDGMTPKVHAYRMNIRTGDTWTVSNHGKNWSLILEK